MAEKDEDFYCRYYIGHKGMFGHEFLEFEFRGNGKLRYANNSKYKQEVMIRKEVFVSKALREELKKLLRDGDVMKADDAQWPEPDKDGTQELEIVLDNEHISFTTNKIGSLMEVSSSKDADSLRNFYYLVQDIKVFVFALVTLHFKIKPVPI